MNLYSKRFIIPTLVITFIYVILITYLMNVSLLKDTLLSEYSIVYKFKILFTLFQGMWTAMSGLGLTTLFLIALLTGANLTLLFSKIRMLKNSKNLKLVVGGNSILGIVASGCATCGLPVLSLLGLGGSLMYLPYRGAELSYVSIILLAISFYLLVKNNNQACAISYEKN